MEGWSDRGTGDGGTGGKRDKGTQQRKSKYIFNSKITLLIVY